MIIEGDYINVLIDDGYRLAATRAQCRELIDEAVTELASRIYAGASAYDVAMCNHDSIIAAIDYAYGSDNLPEKELWAHNIIGVLGKKGAVCEGYARTFQLLLNYSDVENLFVTGKMHDVNHAWNLVRLDDGKWYWYDLTYDDADIRRYGYKRDYFCKVDEEFIEEHEIALSTNTGADFLYDLPERSDSVYVPEEPTLNTVFETNGMKFMIVGYNEVTLLEYCGNEENVVLPESISYEGRDMKLIALGENDESKGVFDRGNTDVVKSVSIPSTVRMIWDDSLRSRYLENIYVSSDNTVYTDVDGVLYTKNLYTLIKFPSASKATMFVVPDETYYIAASAFEDCENLSAFTLGANVRYIGVVNWGFAYPTSDKSFKNFLSGNTGKLIDSLAEEKKFTVDPANEYYYADGDAVYSADKTTLYYVYDTVTEFVIPSELKEMERYSNDNVFENCNRLERFSVEEGNPYFAVYDGILYNSNFTAIAIVPKALKGNVTLHEGVTVIGREVFADRIYLTGIALPESLQTINQYAFKGCTSLQNLAIPANVTIILQQAFAGCTSLRSVFLNEGLEILDSEIFINCGKLEEIVIPSTVTTIYKNVFKGCDALEKVIFNEASGWIAVKSYLAHDKITFSPQELTDPITAKDLITGDYADYVWTRENI